MNTRAKSTAVLAGTFLIGALLGGVVIGTITHERVERREEIRKPGGFVRHLESIIEPQDSAQQERVREVLGETDRRNREIIEAAHKALKSEFDSMLVNLEEHLEEEQLDRVRSERMNRPPGKGGRGPGFRPPPPRHPGRP